MTTNPVQGKTRPQICLRCPAEALRAELEARSRPTAAGAKALFRRFPTILPSTVSILRRWSKRSAINSVSSTASTIERTITTSTPPVAKANAEAVVALFDAADVVDEGDGTSRLTVRTFKTAYRLCDSETFADQPCGAFCSGVLIAPDVVASAGHCVDPDYLASVDQIRFVFGFWLTDVNTPVVIVPNSSVYSGKEIIHHRLTTFATDWSLVRLDRPVANPPAVKLRTSGTIAARCGPIRDRPPMWPALQGTHQVRASRTTRRRRVSRPIWTPTAATPGRRCSTRITKSRGCSCEGRRTS